MAQKLTPDEEQIRNYIKEQVTEIGDIVEKTHKMMVDNNINCVKRFAYELNKAIGDFLRRRFPHEDYSVILDYAIVLTQAALNNYDWAYLPVPNRVPTTIGFQPV